MSVHGYSPAVSDTSVPSATSSSHQPPEKQLKALDEKESVQSIPKQLDVSTDEDLGGEQQDEQVDAFTALPVPAVPEEAEEAFQEAEEGRHDADDFVPSSRREQTLERGTFQLHVKEEVFVIADDEKEEESKRSDDEKDVSNDLHYLTATEALTEASRAEGSSSTVPSETVGQQPSTTPTKLLPESSCIDSAAPINSTNSQSDVHDFCNPFKNTKQLKMPIKIITETPPTPAFASAASAAPAAAAPAGPPVAPAPGKGHLLLGAEEQSEVDQDSAPRLPPPAGAALGSGLGGVGSGGAQGLEQIGALNGEGGTLGLGLFQEAFTAPWVSSAADPLMPAPGIEVSTAPPLLLSPPALLAAPLRPPVCREWARGHRRL